MSEASIDSIARQQFASSDAFFNISRMVEASLSNFAAQQQQAVNMEIGVIMSEASIDREELLFKSKEHFAEIRPEGWSLDVLRNIDTNIDSIKHAMERLIEIAKASARCNEANEKALKNLALIIRNHGWK